MITGQRAGFNRGLSFRRRRLSTLEHLMATVKVYGVPISTNVRRVLVALEELHVPYQLVTVDIFKGEHKKKEFTEKYQPFGQVPGFEDSDGTIIFESRAILRYIALKYGKGNKQWFL